ncbi:MAG: DUF5686 and carboxypeptidase regulatory-like domain-containing protein [Paraprevotella sp.]|nr:DUF5686 and carboxypeptidase regulatory-like domain-containing protein [Paraprevotella sp.]
MFTGVLPHDVEAQIRGRVTDAHNGEPIPSVDIYYGKQKGRGVATDARGRYSLPAPETGDTLIFSYIGYNTYKIYVGENEQRTLNIRLQSQDKELSELLVTPKKRKYSRKNNPAVELMRKVIAAKGQSDLKRNDFYRYDKYQRITFGFNNITQRFIDSSFLRKYPLLVKQVEFCPQTQTNILPLTYNETSSEHLYRKHPETERDYVRGTRSEGLNELFTTGDIANIVLQRFFTDVNIYDNSINLLERYFTSPLSSTHAISFYQYFIMDTLEVEGDKCIELSFIPQNPQDFGFSGRLWVLDDSTYRVKRCLVNLPLRSSVNFISDLVIEQEFATLSNGQRVLVKDNMIAELGALKQYHNMLVKRSTTYTGFDFSPISDKEFDRRKNPREGTPEVKDEAFWAQYRTDSLTRSEAGMSTMVQDLTKKRGFGWILWIVRAFVENYIETSPPGKKNYVDFGPVNTVISSNFIDKVRLRASLQTTANLNPHLFLKGYAAYGVRDKKWKYEGELEYSFLKKQYSPEEFPRNSIAVSTRYDVMAPSDALLPTDKDNVFASFKTQTIDQMTYFRQYNIRYIYEFNNHFGITAQLRHITQNPTGALFFRSLSGRNVPKLTQSEATLSMRYAPGEQIVVTKQRRHPVNHNYPIYTLMHTVGFKDVLGGDYASNYTELSVTKRFWLNSYGRIDIYGRAGAQWNRVPFPLLISPAANNSYIIQRGMFNMINNMEFMNDRFVSLDVEWDLSGKLFNRIPLLKHLKWREVIGFKTLYGTLTDKNNPFKQTGADDLMEFPSRNGQPTSFVMGDTPYMELNVGIHNIFKILRIDYVRRLNYLNVPNAKKNGVRFVLQFDF